MPKAKSPAKRKLVTTAGGALTAVRRYFDEVADLPRPYRTVRGKRVQMPKGDKSLAWLWTEGFKVVSTDGDK